MADKLLETILENLRQNNADPSWHDQREEERNAFARPMQAGEWFEAPELNPDGSVKKKSEVAEPGSTQEHVENPAHKVPPTLELPDPSTVKPKAKRPTMPAPDIAKHYAAAWNARGVTPETVDKLELAAVKGALAHTDGFIRWTGTQWQAMHVADDDGGVSTIMPKPSEISKQPLTQPGPGDSQVSMSQAVELAQHHAHHAPKGYTEDKPLVIAGKKFKGGQFIPPHEFAKATEHQKEEIEEGKKEPESHEFKREYESPAHKKQATQALHGPIMAYLTKQGAGKRGKSVSVHDIQKATKGNIDAVREAVKELTAGNMVKREAVTDAPVGVAKAAETPVAKQPHEMTKKEFAATKKEPEKPVAKEPVESVRTEAKPVTPSAERHDEVHRELQKLYRTQEYRDGDRATHKRRDELEEELAIHKPAALARAEEEIARDKAQREKWEQKDKPGPIGRKWADGTREVLEVWPDGRLVVGHPDNRGKIGNQIIQPGDLEKEIALDKKLHAGKKASDVKKSEVADAAKKQADTINDTSGFADSMTPMAKKKAIDALNRTMSRDGQLMSRKDIVRDCIAKGYKVEQTATGERRLKGPDGSFLDESQISKTAMDFAEHLIGEQPQPKAVQHGDGNEKQLEGPGAEDSGERGVPSGKLASDVSAASRPMLAGTGEGTPSSGGTPSLRDRAGAGSEGELPGHDSETGDGPASSEGTGVRGPVPGEPGRGSEGHGGRGTSGTGGRDGSRTRSMTPPPATATPQETTFAEEPMPDNPTDAMAGNFRYTSRDFAQGGLKAKFNANIAAIKTLKAIQAEGRTTATPEEQAVMSRFIGWGQFPSLFNYKNEKWKRERKLFTDLLGHEEFTSARDSINNAHFTDPSVVDVHYKVLEKLGFKGGRLLETSAGIGYYLGLMPEHLARKTKVAAVEKDLLSGQMLKMLYPGMDVGIQGFEEHADPPDFYDVCASNVPFGTYSVHDPEFNRLNPKIHDYFFLKSAKVTRPGGLVAHITSTGSLDSPDSQKVREELAKTCDFVGAIRFPENSHLAGAGTAVCTDLVLLRKRHPGEKPIDQAETPPEAQPKKPGFTGTTVDSLGRLYHWRDGKRVPGPDWTNTTSVPDPAGGDDIRINNYFVDHPEHVLGTVDRTGHMYGGNTPNVSGITADNLTESLGRKVLRRQDIKEGDLDEEAEAEKGRFVYSNGERVPPELVRKVERELYDKRLAAALESIPEGVLKPRKESKDAFTPERLPAPGDVKVNGFTIRDGKVFRREGGALVEQEGWSGADLERLNAHLELRDAKREVVNAETEGRDATAERAKLNQVYDKFLEKYGPLHTRANASVFSGDPDAQPLLALEHYDAKTNTVKKADMFSRETIRSMQPAESAETAGEALGICLHETGSLDLGRIAQLLGKSKMEVSQELVESGLAFRDPSEGWLPADQYLSGNVREKLTLARAAAAVDPTFLPNVKALEDVQPPDVYYGDISVKLGAAWVPASDIQKFAGEALNLDADLFSIAHVGATGEWTVGTTASAAAKLKASPLAQEWSIMQGDDKRAGFIDMLDSALNGRSLTIYDPDPEDDKKKIVNRQLTDDANSKVQDLKDKFKEWVWQDEERQHRLHRYYNDNFNNIVNIKYDGSHQKFPGMDPNFKMNPHQSNFCWQVVTTGNGLAAHEVGSGKSASMIAAAMELRRLGLARKPCIACLKANVEAMTEDVLKLYPGAKVLSVVDVFDAKSRKETISRVATGDYDVVIMTHDNLGMLRMQPEQVKKYIQEEMDDLEAAIRGAMDAGEANGDINPKTGKPKGGSSSDRAVKALENAKKKLKARLQAALDETKRDDAVFFEHTGIDFLMVDEVHKMKNLKIYTRANRIKGIPTGGSNRAQNMLMFSRWLQEKNNGRGFVGATGTPVTNTMAELYNMQRFFQMPDLKKRGIDKFDAWANQFGEQVTKAEKTITGEVRPVTRFSEFVNVPELMQLANQVIDVQRTENLKKPDGTPSVIRPQRKDYAVRSPRTEAGDALMASLVERANEVRNRKGPPQKGDDNMLVICTDGRKGSIDMRLLDPKAPDNPNSKVNKMVANILKISKENPGGTQLVFSDVGVNPPSMKDEAADRETEAEDEIGDDEEPTKGFHLYGDIIDKLVKGGIPRDKIADFSKLKGKAKEAAAESLRKGEMLVGLGSTEKMGTGVNVQNRGCALHHLDVPWVPAHIEQRNGRFWRQGNKNKATKDNPAGEVDIYTYVTEGSLDEAFWGTVARKAGFIRQVMDNDNPSVRTFKEEDTEELSFEQLSAIASGDSRSLDRVNLAEEVRHLQSAESRHQREENRAKELVKRTETRMIELNDNAAKMAGVAKHIQDSKAENPEFSVEIAGETYTDREAAQAAFEKRSQSAHDTAYGNPYYQQNVHVGTYRGMDIYKKGGIVRMVAPNGSEIGCGDSLGSVEAIVNALPARAKLAEHDAQKTQKDIEKLQTKIGKPFQHTELLKKKSEELKVLEAEMKAKADAEAAKRRKDAGEAEPGPSAPTPLKSPKKGRAASSAPVATTEQLETTVRNLESQIQWAKTPRARAKLQIDMDAAKEELQKRSGGTPEAKPAPKPVAKPTKEHATVQSLARSIPDHLGAYVPFGPDKADSGVKVGPFALKENSRGGWAIHHAATGLKALTAKNKTAAKVAAAVLAQKGDWGFTNQSDYGGDAKERLQQVGKYLYDNDLDGLLAMYNSHVKDNE